MKKHSILKSFIEVGAACDFPIENLPYGIIQPKGCTPRVGVAIGDFALDLSILAREKMLKLPIDGEAVFDQSSLNSFAQLGRPVWLEVRKQIQNLLSIENPTLRDNFSLREKVFWKLVDIDLLIPFSISGYSDFYASQVHATNIGRLYRGEENALMPNWKHIPIAYNGRASSVVVSGTPVVRPQGQIKLPTNSSPTFETSKKLDIEVEVGFFLGKNSNLGEPISLDDAKDYIFGLVLLNDWSARDIQAWEYQPLGPFLGKSFATTISPWVVPMLALEEAKVDLPIHDPLPLPYLRGTQYGYNIEITAELKPKGSQESTVICRTNTEYLYWSFAQMLVHHSSNGCPMRVGDLLGSGTISGSDPESWGSLVERSFNGKQSIPITSGEDRAFLLDGDEVVLRGSANCNGYKIGFGQAVGRIQENTENEYPS